MASRRSRSERANRGASRHQPWLLADRERAGPRRAAPRRATPRHVSPPPRLASPRRAMPIRGRAVPSRAAPRRAGVNAALGVSRPPRGPPVASFARASPPLFPVPKFFSSLLHAPRAAFERSLLRRGSASMRGRRGGRRGGRGGRGGGGRGRERGRERARRGRRSEEGVDEKEKDKGEKDAGEGSLRGLLA